MSYSELRPPSTTQTELRGHGLAHVGTHGAPGARKSCMDFLLLCSYCIVLQSAVLVWGWGLGRARDCFLPGTRIRLESYH